MRTLWLLLGMMAIAPTWAVAGEPTGFDGIAFGTTRGALVGKSSFRARCHPATETETAVNAQGWRVTCPTYDLSDFGAMRVALLFSAKDQLFGYVVYIPRDRQDTVRAKFETRYGPPTSRLENSTTLGWRWPSGTEASLTVFCLGSDGCLTVKAQAPEKR